MPDDPDGLCYWMYVRYVHNNVHAKHIRIRSADPTCFDMDKDCTDVGGFLQIGNQIGYISNYDGNGNRLYLRITFCDYEDEDEYFECECPSCGETVCFDCTIDPEELTCPACGEKFECIISEDDLEALDEE